MARIFNVGTRTSPLALKQVEEIEAYLKWICPGVRLEIVRIDTPCDRDKKTPLSEVEGTDFFTREIDEALLKGQIDFAVHSAKDLPDRLPQGIGIVAVTESLDPFDVLVSRNKRKLVELPLGAKIGTSSRSRKDQLKTYRTDFRIFDLRGNIEDRLAQLEKNDLDAIVMAGAGLRRLGLETWISDILDFETFKPHPLQGCLAVTIREDNLELKKIFSRFHEQNLPISAYPPKGNVILVGAGPGDPGLMTVKGLSALRNADVILYDELIPRELLHEAKSQAELINVGKKPGHHVFSQDAINLLLWIKALSRRNVVRLKGGDPYILGRGSEEAIFLREREISFEVIPGISSAVAVPACAGIPLTYRGLASSFAVVAGHGKEGEFQIQFPNADTLVYLMCVSNLGKIVNGLRRQKRPPDLPCAVIENGTTVQEKVIVGTLENIVTRARAEEIQPPAVFIAGPVVNLRRQLMPKKILMTGTSSKRFRNLGELIHCPMIQIKPIADFRELDDAIQNIGRYDWILFTSKFAVFHFLKRFRHTGGDWQTLRAKFFLAIGKTTAKWMRHYGLRAGLIPEEESSSGLLASLQNENVAGKHILFPRSNLASAFLVERLEKLGALVHPLTVYQNLKNVPQDGSLEQIDEVIFTSPSTVENFFAQHEKLPERLKFKALGPVTLARLKQLGKEGTPISYVS
ncbi:MAG: uroporphyrinogen-III C-methyltransferase [Candidatus Omnitrophica bacterium]|nr:uroporphyrinogen-III C-methyltransferase [Candidatus Omnitrophota bacterium]